jgi:hypothetical protein
MAYDETDGWIFSAEAHKWMTAMRSQHGSPFINPRTRAIGGYEFGLFGVKFNPCEEEGSCQHGPERNFCCQVTFRPGIDYERDGFL